MPNRQNQYIKLQDGVVNNQSQEHLLVFLYKNVVFYLLYVKFP